MECKWSTKKENNFVLHLYLSFHLHSSFNRNRERTIQYKSPSLNVARLVVPKISKKSRINITRFLSLSFFFSLPTNHGIHRAILFGFLPLRSSATSSSVGWYGKHVTEPYCLAVARNRVVKIRKKIIIRTKWLLWQSTSLRRDVRDWATSHSYTISEDDLNVVEKVFYHLGFTK